MVSSFLRLKGSIQKEKFMPTQSKPATATRISSVMQRYAAIPLRAIAGGGFVQHGWAKIIKGPEAFAAILQALHVPFPHLSAYLTISVELLGGAALLFGAFIAWASVPAVVVLLTAMFTVHLPYGFSSIKIKAIVDGRAQFGPPGYECDLLYVAVYRSLAFAEAQRLSSREFPGWRRSFVTKRTRSPRYDSTS
jgi:putative oxidoreductase